MRISRDLSICYGVERFQRKRVLPMMRHIHYLDGGSVAFLSEALLRHFADRMSGHNEIVIVCVGTHRLAGDSLGPMVGSRLADSRKNCIPIQVYGTLEKPVHALNLQKTIRRLGQKHSRAYVIAVDACLGQYYKNGTLQLVDGPLQPGAGLDKRLPPIGHIHLKGIINNCGSAGCKALENASPALVGAMAQTVSLILEKSGRDMIRLLSTTAKREPVPPEPPSAEAGRP